VSKITTPIDFFQTFRNPAMDFKKLDTLDTLDTNINSDKIYIIISYYIL
jgi:hypothetical protein